jgi:hypothetical protein
MIEKLKEISAWLISAEGIVFLIFAIIALVTLISNIVLSKKNNEEIPTMQKQNTENEVEVEQTVTVINNFNSDEKISSKSTNLSNGKDIKILFVDDDTKFRVINILKNAGWKKTKIIKDISNFDSEEVQSTDIFFIDIQGVGKKLNFKDEGLGLASAIKSKYPNKKVVIYSAENRGDRFHQALRQADDFLAKNAEPFEFQQTIERLSK